MLFIQFSQISEKVKKAAIVQSENNCMWCIFTRLSGVIVFSIEIRRMNSSLWGYEMQDSDLFSNCLLPDFLRVDVGRGAGI